MAAASAALLGSVQGPSFAEEVGEKKWSLDLALHAYDETDRVSDLSISGLATRRTGEDRELVLRLSVDSLTGASANGAVPAEAAQTFTTPSGKSSYVTEPGATPLDPSFLDTRVAIGANWLRPVGSRARVDYGASLSDEWDYFHAGVNGRYSVDFNRRNTTMNVGLALAQDSISPEGEIPLSLTPMLEVGDLSNRIGDDDKTVIDLLIGVTHVLGRRTLGQLNYTVSNSSGYLTDPYKVVSVVDPVTGDPVPFRGDLNLYLFEGRPDERTRHALFALLKHSVAGDVVDVTYRYMTDDWGIDSHTVDLRYRWNLARSYLQPHGRYYTQSPADFYERVLFEGDPLPGHVSADYRLGDLDGVTFGLKYGRPRADGREWSVRAEFYNQSGTSPPSASVGSLRDFDLFPDVNAVILQFGYRLLP